MTQRCLYNRRAATSVTGRPTAVAIWSSALSSAFRHPSGAFRIACSSLVSSTPTGAFGLPFPNTTSQRQWRKSGIPFRVNVAIAPPPLRSLAVSLHIRPRELVRRASSLAAAVEVTALFAEGEGRERISSSLRKYNTALLFFDVDTGRRDRTGAQ